MRDLTVLEEDLGWHTLATKGGGAPVHDGEVHGGYYAARLRRGEPLVPAIVYRAAPWEPLVCVINGKVEPAIDRWPYLAHRPISHDDYITLCKENDL